MDIHARSSAAAATASVSQNAQSESFASYFSYGQHSSTILAHIALMILGWCFVLPAAVLLSIGRSRLALRSQCLFLVLNALGLLFGIIYNGQTPNLYENNAHHKIGWIVTCIVSGQVVLAFIFANAGRGESKQLQSRSLNRDTFLPIATDDHEYLYPTRTMHEYCRYIDDSQGNESSSSIRSLSSPFYESQAEEYDYEKPEEPNWKPFNLRGCIFNGIYDAIDRIILPFGFIAIATGAVTYGGIFHGIEIFNGLAHFIKGGIFFWYGILTLGRFIGAWTDLGWAWNKKPPACVVGWKAKVPSGEFVESFVIWLYGVTNIFLEHLAGWGKEWTANDLEHVSISIMFFGGGLVGMLFELGYIRNALNDTLLRSPSHDSEDENWEPPKSQNVPLNPMPALIILLLGMMMGSHHQDSMTSTMVHKQWGDMLIGFAIARGMTYFLLFLRPPTSYLPARPPTEIARQVIEAMEFYELDAMFTFTVALGFTAFIMSLVVLTITIKAWAVKRERAQEQR
ncbi:hypothetical protein N7507_006404 [Penicillium longicatenatum]|nr:hypothetical protein N7507_006404 [Penicillium longicatenatum]